MSCILFEVKIIVRIFLCAFKVEIGYAFLSHELFTEKATLKNLRQNVA